jgi:hypothetical protein
MQESALSARKAAQHAILLLYALVVWMDITYQPLLFAQTAKVFPVVAKFVTVLTV